MVRPPYWSSATPVTTVRVSAFCAVAGVDAESFTWIVKLELPAALGVPEITPLLPARLRPPGSEPEATLHVYGGVPPEAWRFAEYAVLVDPCGRALVVMASGCGPDVEIVMLSCFVAALLLASTTLTVKDEVPDAVGVPEIAPLLAVSVKPVGNEPELTLQV